MPHGASWKSNAPKFSIDRQPSKNWHCQMSDLGPTAVCPLLAAVVRNQPFDIEGGNAERYHLLRASTRRANASITNGFWSPNQTNAAEQQCLMPR